MNKHIENVSPSFRQQLKSEFNQYLLQESNKFDPKDCLRIDLHCHDKNSNVPDELWGRILGIPETWLKPKKLIQQLEKNNCDVFTITNHNNARSCWKLREKGLDVLAAAEFTCYFPEYELFVHVLTYGFNQEQEDILNDKRGNIYDFLRYTAQQNIPVILPHPLYFYTKNQKLDLELFEKFAVLFERFEVVNGQRDLWQSVLTLNWVRSLSPEKIKHYAEKHQLNPAEFGVDPNKPKALSGGSDDHMGIFAGECGSMLYVENLEERLKTSTRSELALEAIRNGHISPFGQVMENQKLNIALLDYFSQIATRMEDPGLLHIMLHRGEMRDKLWCFGFSNLLLEMQHHKKTRRFLDFVHSALKGKRPSKLLKWMLSKDYRFCYKYLEKIAISKEHGPEHFINTVNSSITGLFKELNKLIVKRIKKSELISSTGPFKGMDIRSITKSFKIPSHLSNIFKKSHKHSSPNDYHIKQLLDNVSFPVLISLILAGVRVTSTRVLYQNRELLNRFADHIDSNRHQKRALYLTDTLRDKNGVSNSLSGKLKEIQRTNEPVDFLICHDEAEAEPHLHVVRPITSFEAPGYKDQIIRVPDVFEIAQIFYEGGYDRIVCSTEGPMAIASLFIKFMFNVPAYFFMHTDWLDLIRHKLNPPKHELELVRRAIRTLYQQYDGIFVLNSDHREWLCSHHIGLKAEQVFLTAHHARQRPSHTTAIKKSDLFADADDNTPVLFLACRMSREKGIFELPEIIDRARQQIPDLKIVLAGTGPDKEELERSMPDAKFLGWVDFDQLSACYLGLDLFIFPSRFDTYGNVIIESLTHGMPAIAFNTKGPKDIIQDGSCGYLVDDSASMSQAIINYFQSSPYEQEAMAANAVERSEEYQAEPIMRNFLTDMGLYERQTSPSQKLSVAS